MKTPEEIKNGLECCISDTYGCYEKCPYFNSLSNGVDCAVKMHADALAYITQLEARVPKWISVEDMLPTESDGTVLVCFPDVSPYNSKEHFVNAKHDQRVKTATYSVFAKM